jgi:hypothetical protein
VRILLLNPPHIAIGSRIPREQLPPLGLLSIGGPLVDAGHDVTLLDAELGPLSRHEVGLVSDGPTLREFWGEPQDANEVPVRISRVKAETKFSSASPVRRPAPGVTGR